MHFFDACTIQSRALDSFSITARHNELSEYGGQAQHLSQATERCDKMSSPPVPVAGRAPLPPAVASALRRPVSAGAAAAVLPTPAVPPVARAIPPSLPLSAKPRVSPPLAVITSTAAAAARNSMSILVAAPVPVIARRLAYGLPPTLPRPTPRPGTIPVPPVVIVGASAALVPLRRANPTMSVAWPFVACAATAIRVPVPVAFRRARYRRGLARVLGRRLRGLRAAGRRGCVRGLPTPLCLFLLHTKRARIVVHLDAVSCLVSIFEHALCERSIPL